MKRSVRYCSEIPKDYCSSIVEVGTSQHNIVDIPNSINVEHMRENLLLDVIVVDESWNHL